MSTRAEKITASLRKKLYSSDLPLNFEMNIDTGDLLVIKNQEAIKRSIINLIQTSPFERPYRPTLGSKIRSMLFENSSPMLKEQLKTEIESTISRYEPRAIIEKIHIEDLSDRNAYRVTVMFRTINIAEIQNVDIFLERTR